MLQIRNNKIKWGIRLVALVICVFSILSIFTYSTKLNQKNYKMLYDQTSTLSRLMMRQTAVNVYHAIKTQNSPAIELLIDYLEKEDYILDVSIYDKEGNYLFGSDHNHSLTELTGLSTPFSIASIGRHQLVETINYEGQFVGFLRVTLEHGKIIKKASNNLNQNINLIHSMLIIALITGALMIFVFTNHIEFWLTPFLTRHSH